MISQCWFELGFPNDRDAEHFLMCLFFTHLSSSGVYFLSPSLIRFSFLFSFIFVINKFRDKFIFIYFRLQALVLNANIFSSMYFIIYGWILDFWFSLNWLVKTYYLILNFFTYLSNFSAPLLKRLSIFHSS